MAQFLRDLGGAFKRAFVGAKISVDTNPSPSDCGGLWSVQVCRKSLYLGRRQFSDCQKQPKTIVRMRNHVAVLLAACMLVSPLANASGGKTEQHSQYSPKSECP